MIFDKEFIGVISVYFVIEVKASINISDIVSLISEIVLSPKVHTFVCKILKLILLHATKLIHTFVKNIILYHILVSAINIILVKLALVIFTPHKLLDNNITFIRDL